MSSTVMERPKAAANLVAETEALIPFLREQAPAIEARRRLTPEVNTALVEGGFYRLTTAPLDGGAGMSLPSVMRVLETLARGDASTAWSVWASCGGPVMSAFMTEEGVARFIRPAGSCAAGSVAGMGQAATVEGGYLVSGRWPFLSGCMQATWLMGLAVVIDDGEPRTGPDGQPFIIAPAFSVEDCTINDVWQTTGLRGTGSNEAVVDSLFVPDGHVIDFSRAPRQGLSPIHYLNDELAVNVTCASMGIGIARAALDAFIDLAPRKQRRDGGTLADTALAKITLAEAEARYAQARGYLYETAETLWEEVTEGREPGPEWLARTSIASTTATDAAVEIVSRIYRAAGSAAVFSSGALDRCLRDVYTLAAHVTVQRENLVIHGGSLFA